MMRAVREAPPGPGPVWPAKAALSPTSLKTYATCPHRIRLQVIERRKAPFRETIHLEQGNAAHHLLAEFAHRHRHGHPQRSVDELYARAFHRLPKRHFPSREAHEAATDEVMRWVDYGLKRLDREADILAVEKPGRRHLPARPGLGRLELTTRPDLILLRTDREGERYVEIVDYKTGSNEWVDEIPPVTMRFVLKELFRTLTPDTLALRIQFTYVWLAHREVKEIDLNPEYCETEWAKVTGLIDQLAGEREWPTRPSSLCRYCPFNGNACTAFRDHQES